MMVCLLLYAYCVGVFRAARSRWPVNAIGLSWRLSARNARTSGPSAIFASSIWRPSKKYVHGVRLAGEAGLVKLGNVSTDGTKIHGNASRHKAMSYGYMHKEVERLREEIAALVMAAYQQDEAEDAVLGSRRGDA